MNFVQLREKVLARRHHMSQELPYLYFDEETHLFINTSSVGFGLHLSSLTGANDDLVENLNKLLCSLPEGDAWDYQIHAKSTNRVGGIIEHNYQASSEKGGLYETFAENQKIYTTYAAKYGFNSKFPTHKYDLREYSVRFYASNVKGDIDGVKDLLDTLMVKFNQLGVSATRMVPKDLISHVRNTMNFSQTATDYPDYEYNDLEEIYKQSLAVDSEFLDKPSRFSYSFTNDRDAQEVGDVVTYGLQKMPKEFHLFRLPNCFADITQSARAITCPFELSVCFKISETSKESIKNGNRIRNCEKWMTSPMAKLLPHLATELADRKMLQKGLDEADCKVARMSFTLSLFTDKKHLKKDKSAAENAFLNESLNIIPNYMSHGMCLLATLPFMNSDGFFQDLERLGLVRTVKTSNLVNFLPVVADNSAMKLGLLIPTFRRSMYYLDPFTAGGDNFNIACAASSGSGKSFFIQALVKSIAERNGSVWIMDKGDSYWKLVKMFGGTYLNHKDISLNPFTHLETMSQGATFIDDDGEEVNPLKQSISDIVSLFAIMCSPSEPINQLQKTALLIGVQNAYEQHKSSTLVDHVQQAIQAIALERKDKSISDLAYQLTPFCSTGMFGDVFNKPSKLDPREKLTCLELDGFKGDLLQPVVFALIVNINQAMYLSGDRTTPKLCVIEEAWKLMSGKDEAAAEFIEEGYRTARKFKGSFCTVTQGVNDFFKSSGSAACYNNSDIRILLRQGQGFESYIKDNPNAFSPYEIRMIKSFPAAKIAGYSSIMLTIAGRTSFHRLFVDPVTQAMLSTEAEEFEEVRTLTEQGMNIEQAVMTVAKKFYPSAISDFAQIKEQALKIQQEQVSKYEVH